jgi:hypothetical protein
VQVLARNWFIPVLAFALCSGFTNDSAGRACVQQKGERGTGYDVDKTKIKDAYSANGRRMLQDGHRVYDVEVPPLYKRNKPVTCTMSMANGLWQATGPGAFDRNPFAPGNNPFNTEPKRDSDPFTARGRPDSGLR